MTRRRYASPAEKIRFGGKWPRFIPPFAASGGPPNLGFPSSTGGGGVSTTLPPYMAPQHKPLYLQWQITVTHSTGAQGWGFNDFYNAAEFAAGTSPKKRFQWNDTDNANTFYLRQNLNGSQTVDASGPVQQTNDKCVAIIADVNGGQLRFSSFRGGVQIPTSGLNYFSDIYDTVDIAGPAFNIIALDHIPAVFPL